MGYLMNFSRNKAKWDKPFSEKVARRVARLSTSELEGYIDQSVYDVGRMFSAYQKSRRDEYLDELRLGAEVLHAIVEELYKRTTHR